MKRIAYIILWIVLGLELSFVAHAIIEMGYVSYSISRGIILDNHTFLGYGYCFLPTWLQSLLLILGIGGGYFAGQYFWRAIYIEKRYGKLNRNQQSL